MKNLKNTKGVNEEDLIKIICFRSNQQRQEIAKAFNTHYLKDLISEIKSATKDNIQDLLVACMTPTVEFYCKELHRALNPPKTDDNVLIEALCTLNNYEIDMLKKNYLKSEF